MPHKTKINREEAMQLYESGMSMYQLAERYGCRPSAICMAFKKMGVKARKCSEYPLTEKQIAYRKSPKKRTSFSEDEIERIRNLGKMNKGKRARDDYEFGGHEKKRNDGYIKVYVPDHPHASKDGYVMKHILIMERELGRYLKENEVVHHKNRIRDDNRVENLVVMDFREHISMHNKQRYAERRKHSA